MGDGIIESKRVTIFHFRFCFLQMWQELFQDKAQPNHNQCDYLTNSSESSKLHA